MIVDSCQCVGQYQLQVFTVRAQKANLLLCNVVGNHTCGALGCLCSGSDCAFHPDYAGESFRIKVTTNLVISKINHNYRHIEGTQCYILY